MEALQTKPIFLSFIVQTKSKIQSSLNFIICLGAFNKFTEDLQSPGADKAQTSYTRYRTAGKRQAATLH